MKPRDPSSSAKRRSAGRSADARGDTTDADAARRHRDDVGGQARTIDAAVGDRQIDRTGRAAAAPVDRSLVRQDGEAGRPAAAAPAAPRADTRGEPAASATAKDRGPLESLGRAVSAPVREAARRGRRG